MNLVTIHNTQLPVVEYRGQRVVTLAMVDAVHRRPENTARRNFNENKDRFIEGRISSRPPRRASPAFRTGIVRNPMQQAGADPGARGNSAN